METASKLSRKKNKGLTIWINLSLMKFKWWKSLNWFDNLLRVFFGLYDWSASLASICSIPHLRWTLDTRPSVTQSSIAIAVSKGLIPRLWALRGTPTVILRRFLLRTSFLGESNTRRLLGLAGNALKLLGIRRVLLNVLGSLNLMQDVLVSWSFPTARHRLLGLTRPALLQYGLVLVVLLDCINVIPLFVSASCLASLFSPLGASNRTRWALLFLRNRVRRRASLINGCSGRKHSSILMRLQLGLLLRIPTDLSGGILLTRLHSGVLRPVCHL